MTLHGPARPEQFRLQQGGGRWYHDPLPADDMWAATSSIWPSVTTVKRVRGVDWSWTALQRAAHYVGERHAELAGLSVNEIHARLLAENRAALGRAAARGTDVHRVAEQIAAGQQPMGALIPDAAPFLPALHQFMGDWQPEWVLSEAVVISRTTGYGGTLDAIIRVDGEQLIVDWKTRGNKHGAWPEEAWQLAAYAHADYCIITTEDGVLSRQPIPRVTGGLIVSLTTDGYRVYPVDLDAATEGWLACHRLWSAQQLRPIGKPVDRKGLISLPTPPVRLTAPDDEGGVPDQAEIDAARAAAARLPADRQQLLRRLLADVTRNGPALDLGSDPSARKLLCARAFVACCQVFDVEEDIRELVVSVRGADPGGPCGPLISSLTIDQARQLIDLAEGIGAGRSVTVTGAGQITLI